MGMGWNIERERKKRQRVRQMSHPFTVTEHQPPYVGRSKMPTSVHKALLLCLPWEGTVFKLQRNPVIYELINMPACISNFKARHKG